MQHVRRNRKCLLVVHCTLVFRKDNTACLFMASLHSYNIHNYYKTTFFVSFIIGLFHEDTPLWKTKLTVIGGISIPLLSGGGMEDFN